MKNRKNDGKPVKLSSRDKAKLRKVVQNPASASTTAGDSAMAIANANGKLDPLWINKLQINPALTNEAYEGELVTGEAGEALAMGDWVYYKSDGCYWKVKADVSTTMPCKGAKDY